MNILLVEDEVALHPEKVKVAPRHEELPEAPAGEKEATSEACYYASTAFEPGVGEGKEASSRFSSWE